MKIKSFMKYFKKGVLKYFNFHEIFKYFKVCVHGGLEQSLMKQQRYNRQ